MVELGLGTDIALLSRSFTIRPTHFSLTIFSKTPHLPETVLTMTQASQELPPWMTLVSSVLTDSNGQPTATQLTTLQLPLTYYGPSVSVYLGCCAGCFVCWFVWGCDMAWGIVCSMYNRASEKFMRTRTAWAQAVMTMRSCLLKHPY